MSAKLFVLLLLPVLGYSIQSFSCRGRILGGYYADASSGCRAFHVCVRVAGGGVRDFRFRCPPGTLFHREAQTCADWGDDAGDVGCPDDLDDGQFDLYRIGSGFESKKSTYSEPSPSEEEPEFALQRAETGDRRLHQNTQQSQPSNDLRASHSSDFFSGRRDGGRDDTPAPLAPTSTYAPVTRGHYRRPSPRTHAPTTTTTQAPITTQQPSVEPYKRKLIRKRPVYNASQFSTAAASVFTSPQSPVTPAYIDSNAKYSESAQQSTSQNHNNAHYNNGNENTVTAKSYKHDQVQNYNPVTINSQHSHASAPAPAPANDVAPSNNFDKQPYHNVNKNSNYYNAPTGSTDNNYNNANRQHSANNNDYNNNYDANQKYYDTNEYNKIKATVHNSYNVGSVETENVNYNNANNKASENNANNYKQVKYNSADYDNSNYNSANKNTNNKPYYNNENYNSANYNNGNNNKANYNNANNNNDNYHDSHNNNANKNNANNNNANYNQVKEVPSNNLNPSHGNSVNYNLNKVEVSSNINQYTVSTPGYTPQKQSTPGSAATSKKVPPSSAYSSPASVSAYTAPRAPSPAPKVNTIAYNTNTALDAHVPTFSADNVEDDGQYHLPSGEDDGQYRPELYERELLFGAHSINIAASGNRLPEDQRPRVKPVKSVTLEPPVSSVPLGPPAPRPFSLTATEKPKPVNFHQTSSAPQFVQTVSQTQQSIEAARAQTQRPVAVTQAQTQRPVAVTHAQTQRPIVVTHAQTQRPVAITHFPSTTYTVPKQLYSKPQGFSPKTEPAVPASHQSHTPHKVKSDEGKKISSLSKPIKNPKEDTSYDYAYYDSSDPYSEYENIEEFGKTNAKH